MVKCLNPPRTVRAACGGEEHTFLFEDSDPHPVPQHVVAVLILDDDFEEVES